MRNKVARILLICIMFVYLLPLTALASGSSAPPERPYDKIVAKNGSWHAEQLPYDGKASLVVGYKGDWKSDGASPLEMEIKEEIVLSGIYIPLLNAGEGLTLHITDSHGNVYQGFSTELQGSGDVTGIFIPSGDMVLSKERYTLTVEGASVAAGAFLAKGVHFGAYEKYREALIEWELENNPERAARGEPSLIFGEEALTIKDNKYTFGEPEVLQRPVFALDGEYQIDEIIVSTYNDGQGAAPGTISVIGGNGQIFYSGQAYGATIENVANAAWKIAPGILLPAGNYLITLSQPEVLSYDQSGGPLFYVSASIPVQLRPDFTGTYRVNLDAFKTSTRMGPVTEADSSFSLKDFELTVLDKEGELELIGKYEGVPFSQRCEVVEETAEKVVAKFVFAADLTKLPYKAKISVDAAVTLMKDGNGMAQIDISGSGVYDRAATAEKGADYNTYDLKAIGAMTQRELPPFVMTALGKAGGVGSVPGPDNAAQAAAGILFPPLVGLVVNVLQEALKPKVTAPKAVRDKNWYKKKYPGKTDEQLAMIMLADAMGNTDNPDEGDAVSVGDNEVAVLAPENDPGVLSGDYQSEDESGYEPESESESAWNTQSGDELASENAASETEAWTVPGEEQLSQEPETMVLKTSANGAESLYVKDPVTGEWVNPETGGVLDPEKYPEAMEQMQQNKEWSATREQEIQSRGGSEHDKELRKNMEEISRKEEQEAYKNTLRKKYGTDDLAQIGEIVKERKAAAEEWANVWRRNDRILGTMEVGAVAVGTAADIGVDGLSVIVPGGSGFKAGYKVIKGVAGTMADAGAQGKDAFTLANVLEGGVKGAAEAALDKIPGGDEFLGKVMSNTAKGALTMAGEGAGAGVGAALRGEDVGEAVSKGLKDGAYKAAAGFMTDQIAGDLPAPLVNSGSFKAVPNLKNVIVSKAGVAKIVSTIADEYAVKPIVMGD